MTSKYDSPHGCAVGQFCQLSTRDKSFCLHLNESAYISGDTQFSRVQVNVCIFRKNVSLKKHAVTTQSVFFYFSSTLKAIELPSSDVKEISCEYSTNPELTFS